MLVHEELQDLKLPQRSIVQINEGVGSVFKIEDLILV